MPLKAELDSRMRSALRSEQIGESRYYQGQGDILDKLFNDETLINGWIEELKGR